MYLEETEQRAASDEGPQLLPEHGQVGTLTEDDTSAALDGNVFAELPEQLVTNRETSSSRLCMEYFNSREDFTDCNRNPGRSDQYSAIGSIVECVTIHDKTLRLRHPLERWHVRPCGNFEPCVNHSSVHNGSHCAEQQQHIIHEHEPTHHPSEYIDLMADKSDVNCDNFKQSENRSCSFEQLELSQQYKPSAMHYKCCEYNIEDCEKYEMTGFVRGALESTDESDCDTELSEYAYVQNQSMVVEDSDEWGYLSDDSQERGTDDELCAISEDLHLSRLLKVNVDQSQEHIVATDHSNTSGEENLSQISKQTYSDKTFVGIFMEDNASSDGSSSESKSFKTCAEDSESSLNSSGSESEKEAQEDWSDEQTRWESFEEDEEQCDITENVHAEQNTSNFLLEDYFGLFDKGDHYEPTLTKSQHYISCFDGADIHDCLYSEQLKAKQSSQNVSDVTEIHQQKKDACFYSSKKACEGIHGCDSSLRRQLEVRAEDCKGERQLEEAVNVNGTKTHDLAGLLNAPNVEDILAKDDTSDNTSKMATDNKDLFNIYFCQEDMFRACLEKESHWSLMEHEHETLDLVEKYYMCHIKSLLNDPCPAREKSKDSNKDSEISREVPADVIHSVTSQYNKTEEGDNLVQSGGTEDSEYEDCEDDSDELCDCEYCLPPSMQVPTKALLPQLKSHDTGKICVVIDLDETLVHSSFTPVNHADFITPVDIDGTVYQVYVSKRPHVDEFLQRMGEMFECVLFTASLSMYADPVSDVLDKWGAFRSRLFREACVFHKGNYVKDLSHLGRDLNKVIIIDNSPASYTFHPDNAVPVVSWFDDMSDSELLDLIPFFERLSNVDDIYAVLKEQRSLG